MITRREFIGRCGQCALGLAIGEGLARAAAAAAAKGGAAAPLVLEPGDALGLGVERWARTACDLCGLNEQVFIGIKGARPIAVKGIPASTIGFGRLCPRARALVAAASTEDRAVKPMLRRDPATKGTLRGLEPVSWDEALRAAGEGIRGARERLGPSGIALLASDGETCETYALLGRFARAGLGTDHLDTPARLDALNAYQACREVFGVAANPGSVEDADAAQLIILIGGDVAESHPALFHRVLDARRAGRARVALIDGRKTEAAAIADLHLRARPGAEVAVMNALAARLLASGAAPAPAAAWIAWLRGARGAPAPVCRAPLARASSVERRFVADAELREAGVDAAGIEALRALWPAEGRALTVIGPTALGAAAGGALARAAAQLHRASGQWGAAGRGVLFLPRGANATGALAFGIAPGWLPAGARSSDPAARARMAALWGVPADRWPAASGLSALEWPAAVAAGTLGAIVAHRANPAVEMPDALAWREALARTFVVATATHHPTETAAWADVVLPVALVAGETAGTLMSLDRRCVAIEQASPPPGEARAADRVVMDLARASLAPDGFAAVARAGAWSAFAEWDRWRALASGSVYEARGITSLRLGRELDVAWPCVAEDKPGTARVDAEGFTPRFVATPRPAGAAKPTAERPYLLIVGPIREHYRSRVITGRAPELHYDAPTAQLEMHPDDGRALTLADGDWVTVESESGSATARVWLTERALPGAVFLPEHFGFISDLQGGSATQQEPEGLAHRVTTATLVSGSDAPAGLQVAVAIRKAHRRDLRQRGVTTE